MAKHGPVVVKSNGSWQGLAAGSSGQVLRSGGAAADPAYSTATYPGTAGTSGTILRSDGTNIVNTTATYPATAGSAGKILISDGTNIVSSTPTYPNTASTALKHIKSDGTNFVTTTVTYPDAAVTAGKVIVSDGTNYIASTPTFPNASAASGRFIRSDGTNWIASTPTLPTTAGTASTLLRSDGTNFVNTTATYPTLGGTSGTVLRSDGTNWVNSSAFKVSSADVYTNTAQPAVKVVMSANASNVTGDGTAVTVAFDTESYDQASNFNTSTFRFTAPVTGKYLVHCTVNLGDVGAGHTSGKLYLLSNGTANVAQFIFNPAAIRDSNNTCSASFTQQLAFNATDFVEMVVQVFNSTKTIEINNNNSGELSWFNVQLIN